jgi:hypothetical protein
MMSAESESDVVAAVTDLILWIPLSVLSTLNLVQISLIPSHLGTQLEEGLELVLCRVTVFVSFYIMLDEKLASAGDGFI